MKNRLYLKRIHIGFYILFSLLLSLVFVRYTMQIYIPGKLLLGIVAVIAMFGDKNEIMAMCMCCIPLHSSIDFYYSIVICMVFYVVKKHKSIRINCKILLLFSFFVIWELMHGLTYSIEWQQFISVLTPIIALTIILSSDVSDVDYAFVTRMFAVAALAVCFMLISKLIYLAGFDIDLALANLQRLGMDSSDVTGNALTSYGKVNPNTLGVICVLAITGLLQLRYMGERKIKDLIFVGALLIFCVLTCSRTCILCLALMLLLFLFGQKGDFYKKIRFLAISLLSLICIVAILQWIFPGRIDYLLNRFSAEDISNGRISLMQVYHNYIFSSFGVLSYGTGLQDFKYKVSSIADDVPHNSIQEIVVAWGIPGLIAIVTLLVMMILYSKKYTGKRSLISFIPLIIILVKSLAGQMISSGYTMLSLSYAYLSMCNYFSSRSAKNPTSSDNSALQTISKRKII